MPQLHHRDPSIIGLLGASPHLSSPTPIAPLPCTIPENMPPLELPGVQNISNIESGAQSPTSEAFEKDGTKTPRRKETILSGSLTPQKPVQRQSLHLEKGQIADMTFERPYYGLIVDGIHCHPNSVRVRTVFNESRLSLLSYSISSRIPLILKDVS